MPPCSDLEEVAERLLNRRHAAEMMDFLVEEGSVSSRSSLRRRESGDGGRGSPAKRRSHAVAASVPNLTSSAVGEGASA